MLSNPDPVICTCGYDTTKGKHSDDCPMGMFWRMAEMRTAERCAEIASSYIDWEKAKHGVLVSTIPSAAFISGAIKREFGIVRGIGDFDAE